MKQSMLVVVMLVVSFLSYCPVNAGMSLFYIDGRYHRDSIRAEVPITFYILWDGTEFPGCDVTGSTNAYRIYSPTGTPFSGDSGHWSPTFDLSGYDGGVMVGYRSGGGEDSIKFAGFRLFGPGIPHGRHEIAHIMPLDPFPQSAVGGQICIDSTFYPPANPWLWSTTCGSRFPSWSGPHCVGIGSCCQGMRGDLDLNFTTDIADLTMLVDYLFGEGPPSVCDLEADVNASGGTDVADLTYLVDYLFGGGPAPADCS